MKQSIFRNSMFSLNYSEEINPIRGMPISQRRKNSKIVKREEFEEMLNGSRRRKSNISSRARLGSS